MWMEGFGLSKVTSNFHAHILSPSKPTPLWAVQTSQSQHISQRCLHKPNVFSTHPPPQLSSTAASQEHKLNRFTSRFLKLEMPFGNENTIYCTALPANLPSYKHQSVQGWSPSAFFPISIVPAACWLSGNVGAGRIATKLQQNSISCSNPGIQN